jgi:hypothetical protein
MCDFCGEEKVRRRERYGNADVMIKNVATPTTSKKNVVGETYIITLLGINAFGFCIYRRLSTTSS